MPQETELVCLNPPFLPRFSRYSRSPCVTQGGTLYYPLMECAAVAYAEQYGFTGLVVDSIANNYTREQTIALLKKRRPRLVTVATSTPSIYADIAMGDRIKEELPQATAVLVGRDASRAP